jgi:predicted signal transduction protein with EAL and GGDEF domain
MSDATCPMPQNGEIWVDPALHVTRASDTGEIDGVLAVRREMTEQSDLQDKLASLTRTDGLTGHANRRAFDERLRRNGRASRDGTQLSLLLIDVDHFKKFNDHCGHLVGDDCLRALSRILAVHARRASRRATGAMACASSRCSMRRTRHPGWSL